MRLLVILYSLLLASLLQAVEKPNILIIFTDDLGYGDLGCYGATQLETPHIDGLAENGLRLTNAYAPSSVCSPSRFSLLTGRYWWRSQLHPENGVMAPDGPNALMEEGVEPLPAFLQEQGYRTAAFGKWHLGFGDGDNPAARYDWSQPEIKNGPLESGFEHFFGIAANVENHPMLYIENHSFYGRGPDDPVVVEPLEETPWKSRVIPWSEAAYYKEDEVAGQINRKAVEYILNAPSDKPLFVYYATTLPHKPVTPAKEFIGTSNAGVYGDFVHELDTYVGDLIGALRATDRLENTLILFSSDNGAVVAQDQQFAERWNLLPMWETYAAGHRSNGVLREGKHSVYEGGNRIPFIVYWPGKVPANSENADLFLLTDVYATLAAVVDQPPPGSALDSLNFLAGWLGHSPEKIRHSAASRTHDGLYSLRAGKWKLVERNPESPTRRHRDNVYQLYDIEADPGEQNNLYAQYPEIADKMLKELVAIRHDGGSSGPSASK